MGHLLRLVGVGRTGYRKVGRSEKAAGVRGRRETGVRLSERTAEHL